MIVHRSGRWIVGACSIGVALCLAGTPAASEAGSRRAISLDGTWLFQRDGSAPDAWKEVPVPSSFEDHEGSGFDGVGWYRREVPPLDVPEGHRVLLHFQAAATEATVWWNGAKVGGHSHIGRRPDLGSGHDNALDGRVSEPVCAGQL